MAYLDSMMDKLISLSQVVRDTKPCFVSLLNKSILLRQKYMDFYGTEDIRPEFFDRAFQLNIWLLTQFDNFLDIVQHNERVTRYIEFTPQMGASFLKQYDTISRTSYCTQVMFYVDNFLSTLAERINIDIDGGYTIMVNKFPKQFGLTEIQRKILIAPAYFRNANHNNGYHRRGEDFDLSIGKAEFHFKKGEPIAGFNWMNISIAFSELFDVLEVIINSSKAKEVPNIRHNSTTYHDIQ